MRALIHALLMLVASSLAFAQGQPSTHDKAGTVVLAEGDARVTAGGKERAVKVNDPVSEGDLIATGATGEVHLRMADSAFIVVRPNTRFQIVAYVADGGDGDKGILKLISGGVRSITGWIGKFNIHGYKVQTPTATIGIRGTDHETRVVLEGSGEGEPGTYDRVYEGETYIESPAGKVAVTRNRAGFLSLRQRERARLLASIPAFYRPGPHEAAIAMKHAEIQRDIRQRREERRKAVAEKRAELAASRAKTMELLKETKPASRQEKREMRQFHAEKQAALEALQRDTKAAEDLHAVIQRERKALEDDFKAGRTPRAQLAERRNEIQAKEASLKRMQDDIAQRRKAIEEATDAKVDQRLQKSGDEALKQQVEDTREKRKALEEEKASAQQEIKSLQKDEAKRYGEELKADRKGENR